MENMSILVKTDPMKTFSKTLEDWRNLKITVNVLAILLL